MTEETRQQGRIAFWRGARDAVPLFGGYIAVALSFGLVAVQAGLSSLEAVVISTLVYAGASQFLLVAMFASGASFWLIIVTTILINARHIVYGPNLAPYLTTHRAWPWLMHGLTDQVFAMALTRLEKLHEVERMPWFMGLSLFAWLSWIAGTALGAIAGSEITQRWPLLAEAMPFALPALFLVLLAPRFDTGRWAIVLSGTLVLAFVIKLFGYPNAAILAAALTGAVFFQMMQRYSYQRGQRHE